MSGSRWCGYPAAGPLACIIPAFVASTGWRWRLKMQIHNNSTIPINGDNDDVEPIIEKPVEKVFEYAWICLQPSVFAFLGTDIKFKFFKSFDMFFIGLFVIVSGLIVCIITMINIIILLLENLQELVNKISVTDQCTYDGHNGMTLAHLITNVQKNY